jgi:hypothetical protein
MGTWIIAGTIVAVTATVTVIAAATLVLRVLVLVGEAEEFRESAL